MKILIGIPAYNEEQMIGKVIRSLFGIAEKIGADILVVNDGSTDKTYEIVKSPKVTLVNHLLNRGLGGALKTIFAYAKVNGYDILLTFDADGQHKAKDIPKLIGPLIKNHTDVVIGTRWNNLKKVPVSRLIINQFANIITYLLFGIWTADSQSGFRAFNRKAIQKIHLETDGMEVSSEFFREIYKNKLRFVEVPIDAIYTTYSTKKGQKLSNAANVFFQLLLRLLR